MRSPGVRVVADHVIRPEGSAAVELRVGAGLLGGLAARLYGGITERYMQMEADGLRSRSEGVVVSGATELRLRSCILRPWRRGDEVSLARYANNRSVWRNLRDAFPHPYTTEHASMWIASNLGVDPVKNFAIEVDGKAAGSIGVTPFTDVHARSAEIGYWIAEELWGRGITTEAVRAATEHAFRSLDVVRVQAAVFAWNEASMRVLEKCGYAREGVLARSVFKDGQLIDSVLYAILAP
jgi:RimJ/RimL family protein N-acetyltransferase